MRKRQKEKGGREERREEGRGEEGRREGGEGKKEKSLKTHCFGN